MACFLPFLRTLHEREVPFSWRAFHAWVGRVEGYAIFFALRIYCGTFRWGLLVVDLR